MAIDNRFIIKKLQTLPEIFVAFSQMTKMPFVTCDEETFDDQVHIFSSETKVQEFARSYTDQKILLMAAKIPNTQFIGFYGSLFNIGINTVVFHEENSIDVLELEQIVKKKDLSDVPLEKRPIVNPELYLTALYFIQEMRRPVPNEEKRGIKELDEELVANLVKARFLSAVEVQGEEEKPSANNVKIPYIKNEKGDVYQVLFTDAAEFRKFNTKNKLRPIAMQYDSLEKMLIKDSMGYVLNPQSIGIPIKKEQLAAFKKRIQG